MGTSNRNPKNTGDCLYHFEHRQLGRNGRDGHVATLVTSGFYGRRFEGFSRADVRAAVQAACRAFKLDVQVNEVRPRLPPSMKEIKNFWTLDKTQRDDLRALGFDPTTVQADIAKSIFNGFRNLGCRTSFWDTVTPDRQ